MKLRGKKIQPSRRPGSRSEVPGPEPVIGARIPPLTARLPGLISILLLLIAAFFLGGAFSPGMAQSDPLVVMNTTKGTVVIRVYARMVPDTAGNFLDLVSRGFYNGLTFHRVESWCIQGGDPYGNGRGNFIDPQTGQARFLRLEVSPYLHHNAPGVVAMAHAKSPNSGSCQFYITKKPMPGLDGGYSIFGGVVRGMNAVYNMQIGDRILSAEIVNPDAPQTPQRSPDAQKQPARESDSGF